MTDEVFWGTQKLCSWISPQNYVQGETWRISGLHYGLWYC